MICTAVRVIADPAFALMQNVLDRGIETVNIMYEPDSDTVKIRRFGIAHITNSSKTETGMVLGAPSCVSPEKVAGKTADASMGLFSPGAKLYPVLSDSLRFKADSMASLMFKISNEAADMRSACADIPGGLANVFNDALPKNVEQRSEGSADYASAVKVFLKPRS